MKCLLKIRDLTESDVNKIFDIADNIESYKESLKGKKLQCFFQIQVSERLQLLKQQ